MALYDATTVVYVAAFPDPRPGAGGAMIETRVMADGATAALAFTSRAGLVAALGPQQPWIAAPLGTVREWLGGNVLVAVDARVPAGSRRWDAANLAALRTSVDPRREE